ncbi:glycosyltransferase [Curtobacterium sp. SGAir0471]|uniref:glycosyltransferase n=1 Tax=Curtobacterium sp. SGAir0471 TaxID=2070337 RepID=UPI0010F5DC4B
MVLREQRHGGQFVVAVVGRFNGRKGHLDVLHAFQIASKGSKNWQLILAGSPYGDDDSAVQEVIKHSATDDRVRIVGEVRGAAALRPVPDVYACFGDREEAFGLVPLEAWSVGARSAAFAEGGATEVLPVVDGILVARGSNVVGDIAQALEEMEAERSTWLPPTEAAVHLVFGRESRRRAVEKILRATRPQEGSTDATSAR